MSGYPRIVRSCSTITRAISSSAQPVASRAARASARCPRGPQLGAGGNPLRRAAGLQRDAFRVDPHHPHPGPHLHAEPLQASTRPL
jgi:hypothetical protein